MYVPCAIGCMIQPKAILTVELFQALRLKKYHTIGFAHFVVWGKMTSRNWKNKKIAAFHLERGYLYIYIKVEN